MVTTSFYLEGYPSLFNRGKINSEALAWCLWISLALRVQGYRREMLFSLKFQVKAVALELSIPGGLLM